MRQTLVYVGLLVLMGCQSAAPPGEVAFASDQAFQCFARYLPTLDDKISPASSIAKAVAQTCRRVFLDEAEIVGRWRPPAIQQALYDSAVEGNTWIPWILSYRSTGRIEKALPGSQ